MLRGVRSDKVRICSGLSLVTPAPSGGIPRLMYRLDGAFGHNRLLPDQWRMARTNVRQNGTHQCRHPMGASYKYTFAPSSPRLVHRSKSSSHAFSMSSITSSHPFSTNLESFESPIGDGWKNPSPGNDIITRAWDSNDLSFQELSNLLLSSVEQFDTINSAYASPECTMANGHAREATPPAKRTLDASDMSLAMRSLSETDGSPHRHVDFRAAK
jgi:hypothetical protein